MLAAVSELTVPTTPTRDFVRTHHNDTVVDSYEWLRDKEDPEVLEWLKTQNEYAEARTADLADLRKELFDEYVDRIQETDMSVPVRMRGYWYYSRTQQGQQYAIQCRVRVNDPAQRPEIEPGRPVAGEQVILDGNAEAADNDFFSLGGQTVSPDDKLLAYSLDTSGDERFDVRVKNIRTGEIMDDVVRGVGYGLVWSACGNYFWYTKVDDAWRPFQVWRHAIGTTVDSDELVYAEDDEKFWMGIDSSDDDQFLIIQCGSKTTDEVSVVPLAEPCAAPRVIAPRQQGVEYSVTSAGDRFVIVHNRTNPDFDIAVASLDAPAEWTEWVSADPGQRIVDVEAFRGHIVIAGRANGLTSLHVATRDANSPAGLSQPVAVPFDEELFTVSMGSNPEYSSSKILLTYQSMVTPRQVLEYDLVSGERTLLRQQPVLGDVDLSNYRQARSWATAADGTRIPVSYMHHKDTPLDGTAPCLLYGYGSYEHSIDPTFQVTRLSYADRGVVFAIAHIRGGGEMGRAWYAQGKMEHKRNTFTDFVSVADHLDISGVANGRKIAALGGSAGGLLVGAAMNIAPERFCAVHAAVPFVDNLTTILDPELPLTVPEWEEWGNPLHYPEVYAYIKSYSPYENVAKINYPAVLATTSLNDTRVFYTEPAKWVAKLQASSTSDPAAKPVLLRTEMVAGHGGRSGRYDALEELSWEMGFMLAHLEATTKLA